MPTYSARAHRKPRYAWYCDECARLIDGPYIYAYGDADDGCQPFGVRLHVDCARKWCKNDPKFTAAVAAADAKGVRS